MEFEVLQPKRLRLAHVLAPVPAAADVFSPRLADRAEHGVSSTPNTSAAGNRALDGLMTVIVSLLQQFTTSRPLSIRPVLLKTQLYTVTSHRTTVDRDLDTLRQNHGIRMFKLATGADDHALMLASDYGASIRDAKEKQTSSKQHTDSELLVFDWFIERVLPQCTEMCITHGQLVYLLANTADTLISKAPPSTPQTPTDHSPNAHGAFTRPGATLSSTSQHSEGPRSGSTKKAPTGIRRKPSLEGSQQMAERASVLNKALTGARRKPTTGEGNLLHSMEQDLERGRVATVSEGHVSLLLTTGCLRRDSQDPQLYHFSIPEAGPFALSVAAGRREFLSMVNRRRYKEIPAKEVMGGKLRLRSSALDVRFHVTDLLGAGTVHRIDTAAGPVLKLITK